MTKKRKFDCVKMKSDIQQEIEKRYKNISDKEAYNIQKEKIIHDPILGSFIKKIQVHQKHHSIILG